MNQQKTKYTGVCIVPERVTASRARNVMVPVDYERMTAAQIYNLHNKVHKDKRDDAVIEAMSEENEEEE